MLSHSHPVIQPTGDPEPVLECTWEPILLMANSTAERLRVERFNPSLRSAPYPLTREKLNLYYNQTDFYLKRFHDYPDCASAMYSYFLATYGQTSQTSGGGSKAVPGKRGEGTSFGFNPLFGFDSPLGFWLWLLILTGGYFYFKK